MARKLNDYTCLDCNETSEQFIDEEKEKAVCSKCGSENMKKVLSVGEGNTKHISWAKWRA